VMYEEAIHVPMLLRVPWRQSRQTVVPQPVGHIDLVPTILELMQSKPAPESLPGESWLGLLNGKPRREDHVFVQWKTDKDVRSDARTVISPDGWKLALYEKDNCMLFNRQRDPLEMSNLYYRSEYRATVRKLRDRIQKWQEQQRDTMPLPEEAKQHSEN
jgi:arylsulfatase A-like enzyme